MITPDQAVDLMQNYGLWLLAPVAVLEGPIITVIAGYLAHIGAFNPVATYIVVVLADLVGDVAFYFLGVTGMAWLPASWRRRLGLSDDRLDLLVDHFLAAGGRTLIVGKLTHSLGALALVAAGMARMPFLPFLWYNFVATLPKSLFFLLLGYSLGVAYQNVNGYIFWFSLIPIIVLAFWGLHRFLRRREKQK